MTSSQTPEWFANAIAQPVESRFVDVDGTPIHYLTWNVHETHKPALVLAHGFRAHARWWSFIAPFLTDRFRVAALDFAGMGDSGYRREYSHERYVQDVVGVITSLGPGRVTLVGHSFAGWRVMRTCADHPTLVERAVVIDSFIPVPGFERRGALPMQPRSKVVYPSYEAARARFRLVPPETSAEPYVLDYVAQHSIKQIEDGWTWKFDEKGLVPHTEDPTIEAQQCAAVIARVQAPLTIIYGQKSIVLRSMLAHQQVRRLACGRGPIEIPEAHHHVMLDQPLSLVAALRGVLY